MDLIDINENPLTRRGGPLAPSTNVMEGMRTIRGEAQAQLGGRSAARLAGPAGVPQVQAPWYTPEGAPGLGGPQSAPRLAAPSNVPAQQVPFYTPEQAPRIAGPSANLPAQQAPWYTPESPARLGGPTPSTQLTVPAQAGQPSGPLSRAAGMSPAGLAAGAIGLLAGGAAATGAAAGGVAANPDYFKTSIGDDGLVANILSAAQPQRIADVAQTARTQNGPLNVPVIAQRGGASSDWMSASDAGAGRGSINPPSAIADIARASTAPRYDDTYRATNLTNMTNQAYREGDPIGDIIRQKMGPQQDVTQPADNGGGSFLNVGAQSGGQRQSPIRLATFGGGEPAAYYQDGSQVALKAGQPLPDDVQQFNRISQQAGQQQDQPVQVIRGTQVSMAMPTDGGPMREASQAAYDAGKVPEFFAAQAQNSINAADPLGAKTAAEIAKVQEENKGKVDAAKIAAQGHIDAARITNSAADADRPATTPILGVPVPTVTPWSGQTNSRDANKVKAAEIARGAKEVEKDGDAARALAATAQDAKQFIELNKKVSSGGVMDKTAAGRWVKGFDSDYANLEAITAKLTPAARPPGSGSSSDSDIKMFGRATIGVDKPQKTNENIAKGIIANAQQQQDYANFRQTYLEQNGTLQGADRYWKEYANQNPIFDPKKEKEGTFDLNPARKDWREHFAPKTDGAAPAGGASAGGQPPAVKVVPFNGAQAEARRAPDGNYYVKQPNGKYAMVKE